MVVMGVDGAIFAVACDPICQGAVVIARPVCLLPSRGALRASCPRAAALGGRMRVVEARVAASWAALAHAVPGRPEAKGAKASIA